MKNPKLGKQRSQKELDALHLRIVKARLSDPELPLARLAERFGMTGQAIRTVLVKAKLLPEPTK